MSLFILKNEQITLAVESHGAEMKSLKSNETGLEYLWQADPVFWVRTSPILFPVVGKYKDNTTYYEDKTITLSQHGFARDSEFTLVSQTEDTIWLCLKDDEKTFSKYAPLVGIWTPVEKDAPFVCIEPWYGRSDRSLFNQQLAEREYGQKLEYNEVFEADYTIEVM